MVMQKRRNPVRKDITFFKLILSMGGRVGFKIQVSEMPFGAEKMDFGILETKEIFVATLLETYFLQMMWKIHSRLSLGNIGRNIIKGVMGTLNQRTSW